MGLITTLGKFCFIECDALNCNRKMEHIDQNLLQELSLLCGWKNRGGQWICPDCSHRLSERTRKLSKRSGRSKAGRPEKSA